MDIDSFIRGVFDGVTFVDRYMVHILFPKIYRFLRNYVVAKNNYWIGILLIFVSMLFATSAIFVEINPSIIVIFLIMMASSISTMLLWIDDAHRTFEYWHATLPTRTLLENHPSTQLFRTCFMFVIVSLFIMLPFHFEMYYFLMAISWSFLLIARWFGAIDPRVEPSN